ncbi:hypothetical protein FM038_003320 [Shewanella eurypsychrophilus]|uniref:MvaI/BcnI restriction endonuclease domain-containing protein n=1 Tax=Shewanella eurypsychrophilus TaxID=2593656 RepID=A0ABX6V1R0_9GAMM|nr:MULTISPECIES: MvaI/BcnI family restriction endonuclease [Shewanella]QFU21269.1 hypothetical protein FS418_04900 [Shewanella sp. YLB-09]QPG56560.1 hypothetical protein FM038_003320 [Shewanella eurypsychrophilus]
MKNILPTESRLKQDATRLKKKLGIKQSKALDLISHDYGYSSWFEIRDELDKRAALEQKTPDISLEFVEAEDVELNEEEFENLENERYNDLTDDVKLLVEQNKRSLVKLGIEFSLFEPTLTGLKKAILDATQTVRTHFELENFHFYWEQEQGQEHKVKKVAYLLTDQQQTKSISSLYRPNTKKGDPRMWFRGLPHFSEAGDQVAIIIQDDETYLINLSTTNLESSLAREKSYIKDFFSSFSEQHNSVAEELLEKLRALAQRKFPALRKGDTAIGYTLEAMLDIEANSSKLPDYKGIELKAGRGMNTRTTMFAQVAEWDKSPCKKSAEILNKYGYERGDDFKLYCTITTQRENPQGLSFIYDQFKDELQEWHNKSDLVAVWSGDLLRKRLKEKHTETFWVEAKSESISGVEYFQLLSVTHTKAPVSSQLMPLLQSGVITMDHLIKRSGKNNKVSEKGPLFKINKRDLELLFPKPISYNLK